MKAGIVGVSGYSGMVLFQLLNQHPNIDEINLYGHNLTKAQPLSEVVPPLAVGKAASAQIEPYDEHAMMTDNDVIFFATSAGVTSQLAAPFIARAFPVIDLSGDYRLKTPALYERWYHKPAAPVEALTAAHYGLAEFESAQGKTYVANPGCYATATLLGLAPLIQDSLVDVHSLIVDAKSGTSGAGKKLTELTHFSQTNENLQLYKINQHQHIPEVVQELQKWNPSIKAIQFNTTLLPITRGLMSTIYAQAKPGVTQDQLVAAFAQHYRDQPVVILTGERFPNLKEVVGTAYCKVGVVYNEETNVVMVVSVIDNLIKGAGGQAVQNLNQMFGFDELAGLPTDVIVP